MPFAPRYLVAFHPKRVPHYFADVLVFVSHFGRWPELARAARAARTRGASVIALTDPASPLAGEASLLFECRTPEDTNVYTPMSSRLAQLALLDALQVSLALQLGGPATANLRDSKRALAEVLRSG